LSHGPAKTPAWNSYPPLQSSFELRSGDPIWKAWTGQWAHFSKLHLLWNVAAFGVLAATDRRQTLSAVGFHQLCIAFALWMSMEPSSSYRGLSGVTVAMLTHGVLAALLAERSKQHMLLALGFLGILCACFYYQSESGSALVVHGDFSPSVRAHMFGLCAGTVTAAAAALGRATQPGAREAATPSSKPSTAVERA